MDGDDDAPVLSAHALAALQEFMREKDAAGDDGVGEDWRLSQFWYDQSTASTLAAEVSRLVSQAEEDGVEAPAVACIACPSLYTEMKKSCPGVAAQLFEYDRRFSRHGSDFTYYDYNHPEDLPDKLEHSFQVVVADPPYLSEDCLKLTSKAVQLLSMDACKCPILLLTGAVQQERAFSFMGLRPCKFRPSHKNKLGNQFKLYTNYEPPMQHLGGWEEDDDKSSQTTDDKESSL